MKQKYITLMLATGFMVPCAFVLIACGGGEPEKKLTNISVVETASGADSLVCPYKDNIEEDYELSDFTVTAYYSDNSSEVITENITMTQSGTFDCITNNGKFIFTYQEKSDEIEVSVTQKSIEDNDIILVGIEDSYTLSSTEDVIEPTFSLMWGNKELVENVDYTYTYGENNKNSIDESGYVVIVAEGNYTGSITEYFDIEGVQTENIINFPDQTDLVYDGNSKLSDIQYPDDELELLVGVESALYSYSIDGGQTWLENVNLVDAGSYKVKLHFIMEDGYAQIDDVVKNVTILPLEFENVWTSSNLSVDFANRNIIIDDLDDLTLRLSEFGSELVYGVDYDIDTTFENNGYLNNFNVGQATLRLKSINPNFSGTKLIQFSINPLDLSEKVLFNDFQEEWIFNGKDIEPTFSLSYNGLNLVKDTDYIVEYSNNKFAGTGNVNISFSNNYCGYDAKSFTIKPFELDISCLEFENETFVYNATEQKIEISDSSLGTLIYNIDPVFAKMLFNPSDMSTIRYVITYSYTDEYDNEVQPINAGNYKAYASFEVFNGGVDSENYYNSIKLKNGETAIEETENAMSASYTIAPFEINATNTIHQFKNEEYRENNSVAYTGEYINFTTQLVIDLGGNTETFDVYDDYESFYPRTYGGSDAGTYTLKANFDSENTNYVFSKDTWGLEDLTFIINKLILTAENFDQYMNMPTITAYVSNNYKINEISELDPKVGSLDYLSEEENHWSIVNYYPATEEYEVALKAENFELESTLKINAMKKSFDDFDIIGTIKTNTTDDLATATDVTETFFDDYYVEAGTYIWFYLKNNSFHNSELGVSITFDGYSATTEQFTDGTSNGVKVFMEAGDTLKMSLVFSDGSYIYGQLFSAELTTENISNSVAEGIDAVYVITEEKLSLMNGTGQTNRCYVLYTATAGNSTDYEISEYAISSGSDNTLINVIVSLSIFGNYGNAGVYTSDEIIDANKYDVTTGTRGTLYVSYLKGPVDSQTRHTYTLLIPTTSA